MGRILSESVDEVEPLVSGDFDGGDVGDNVGACSHDDCLWGDEGLEKTFLDLRLD